MANWESILESLVATRRPALVGYAYVLTGDVAEAEDVVHDAILRTFSKPRGISDVHHAEAYVRRAIATTFLNRRRTHRRFLDKMHLLMPSPGELQEDQNTVDATSVREALRLLTPRERACVVLRFYEDLLVRDIAAELGIAEGSVKRYLSDGIAKLTTVLGPLPEFAEAGASGPRVTVAARRPGTQAQQRRRR